MSEEQRVPKEVLIGDFTNLEQRTQCFADFVMKFNWREMCDEPTPRRLWEMAHNGHGASYWGDPPAALQGWSFDELRSDLHKVIHEAGCGGTYPKTFDAALYQMTHFGGDPEDDWIVPGFLGRRDRMILTGEVSAGKSLFLEQFAVQVACGIHPFTGERIVPNPVVLLDTENPERELVGRLISLHGCTPDDEQSQLDFREGFRIHSTAGTIDLLEENEELGYSKLSSIAGQAEYGLLILGPIYKLVDGDTNESTVARRLLDALDKVREDYGCAIILEAHPLKDGGAGPPTGSAVWKQWPEIGLGLGKDGRLNPWRAPRRSGIVLPARLERDNEWDRSRWPFRPATSEASSASPAMGLEASLLDFLASKNGEEFTLTRLAEDMRATGASFSNGALGKALEKLRNGGSIAERKDKRSRIFRYLPHRPGSSAEDAEDAPEVLPPSSSPGGFLEAPEEDDGEDRSDDLGEDFEFPFEDEEGGEWEDDLLASDLI